MNNTQKPLKQEEEENLLLIAKIKEKKENNEKLTRDEKFLLQNEVLKNMEKLRENSNVNSHSFSIR